MFERLKRALRSLFGGLIKSIEDPKLILEQNIRDLNDQIPQMNENIATVRANLLLLQKEAKRNDKQIIELTSKIKSAIKANRDDIAEGYALKLEKAKETLTATNEQLVFAEKAYEKALKVKKVFMREKDRKIQEAKEALRASERAEWQAKIADTLEQFEMGGIDQTHNEMITRLNEETAKNEARMEIALESIDTDTMEIEANAEKIRAQELVEQFKMEMNESEGRIEIEDAAEAGKESSESTKTVGKEKEKN